ncbi:MAG: hypothetical protein HOP11_08390, partial [Saprospiraceae bacterium]|nr:hypothetical protein [Saprospiraceae bacterium]
WIIDGYAMTKDYYWRIFFKTKVTDEDKKLLEVNRTFAYNEEFSNPDDYVKKTIGYFDFEKVNSTFVNPLFQDSSIFLSPPFSCKITKELIYSPTLEIPYSSITKKEHAWLKVSVDYFPIFELKESNACIVIHFTHKGKFINKYKGIKLGKDGFTLNQWNHQEEFYLTPYPLSLDDKLKVFVYSIGNKEIYIDNLHIEAYERKW